MPQIKNKKLLEDLQLKGYLGENCLSSIELWLRDIKQIHCEIFFSMFHKKWFINNYFIDLKKLKKIEHGLKETRFESYNDALEFAIQQMLLKI